MSDDFEIISRITDEISSFIEEIGVEPTQYEYDYSFDPECSRYAAVVKLISGSMDGVADAFAEYQYEFTAHMSATFPGVEVVLTVQAEDGVDLIEEDVDEDDDSYLTAIAGGVSDDDISTDDIDSIEQQYADEGLYIIDEDDEDALCIDEKDSDGDEDDDEDELYEKRQQDVSDDSDYRPSAEDMEDLWRAFGTYDE